MLSDETIETVMEFAREREWEQFHTPETLAKSISIEAAELLERFQWSAEARDGDMEHVADELADVLTYSIEMSHVLGVDMDTIVRNKLEKTREKYPVETSKGNSSKYRKLQ
ncbi:nucleotide pyrophosphohydrolase [Bifidobacterium xylocopae]|uniref:Nucleotide pyrophosphohydrolase n=1 Tax=Bifidobacterium xylocopae TaxID=2493119 RepID=A0A366KFE7_9BIFI|nr:nucleotide pyrophosphohydrolase [Bifidobacterium xylocopae]RBP99823.1 nucleotide pyrophosphohydrolase [Bifidobacterium xylocopae]